MKEVESIIMIHDNDFEFFKQACESIDIKILSREPCKFTPNESYVCIVHQIQQDLFFLGRMVELKKKHNELDAQR